MFLLEKISSIFKKNDNPLLSRSNQKKIKKYQKIIDKINNHYQWVADLSDDELKEKVNEYKAKINKTDSVNEIVHKNLNQIKSERELKIKLYDVEYCFALIRESAKRTLKLNPYDVQLLGSMVLLNGSIAEMRTGEGKTLVAAMTAVYQALHQKQVFVLTVNDYLSNRDMHLMNPLYDYWGLSAIDNPRQENLKEYQSKKEIYQSKIIYSTSHELCFDYLRLNTVKQKEDVFFYPYADTEELNDCFIVIDEADSILIDNAKSPLILSEIENAPLNDILFAKDLVKNVLKRSQYDEKVYSNIFNEVEVLSNQTEKEMNEKVDGDFFYNEAERSINMFESSYKKIEEYLLSKGFLLKSNDLYSGKSEFLKHIYNAIQAEYGYHKDVDYLVQNDQVIIVDKNTGRLHLKGRWTNGLHQAIECKENVTIQPEDKTSAQITFQSFFSLFQQKSGMTGTAYTEKEELWDIYHLDVVVIPTNQPVIRIDHPDMTFLTESAKYNCLKEYILSKHQNGQPILIGTPSVTISEKVETLLKELNVKYEILNAKNFEREAQIIENAGRLGAITVSTNMAGRGTDIILGGKLQLGHDNDENILLQQQWNEERNLIMESGGLCVIGVDKNDSRRIDNQLIGRAGRQGECGESVFFVSLDDGIITNNVKPSVYQSIYNIACKVGLDDTKALSEQNMYFGSGNWMQLVPMAQREIEKRYSSYRKNTLKFDRVLHMQRLAYYKQRMNVLENSNQEIKQLIEQYFYDFVIHQLNVKHPDIITKEKYKSNTGQESYALSGDDMLFLNGLKTIIHEYNQYTEKTILDKIATEINDKVNLLDQYATIDNAIQMTADILIWIYESRWNAIKIMEGQDSQQDFERATILNVMDELWSGLLESLEIIKQSSALSVYAQKDPLQVYIQEAHSLFLNILDNIPIKTITDISKVNMDINLLDLSNIQNYHFSKDIADMSKEELEEELRALTSQLMKAEQLKLHNMTK